MARAMQWVDVFKALLKGGYIRAETDSWSGKTKYTVHERISSRQLGKTLGHITKHQFEELGSRGIIDMVEDPETGEPNIHEDKYGNTWNYWELQQMDEV